MVEVQCPHCDKNIELGHGESGLFHCPYCDGEFEYESTTSQGEVFEVNHSLNSTSKTGLVLLIVSLGALLAGLVLFKGAYGDFNDTSTECDEPIWVDNWGSDRGCETEGDYGFQSFCCGIILIFVGIGVGISAVISLITGSFSGNKYVVVNRK